MYMPKLSVIVPVYNGEQYIKNLIENLMSSTYKNIEVLLIDDGSIDKSYEICKELSKDNSKIKVFHKDNGGIASARSMGLYYATGEYIAFVDQDDEISPDMYLKMISRIIKDHSQIAICGTCRKRNGEMIIFEKFQDSVYEQSDIRDNLLFPMLFKGFHLYGKKEINIYPTIWKCIISRPFITKEKMKFISFINYEDDLLMLLQLLLKAERVSTLSDILYYWNTNINSETYKNRYIEGLERKQHELTNYIYSILERSSVDEIVLENCLYVLHSRNVLQLMDNLLAVKKEKIQIKVREIKRNESVKYIQTAKMKVKSEKGYIRNALILSLVIKRLLLSAYVLNKLINSIRFFVIKNPQLEMLERKIKNAK